MEATPEIKQEVGNQPVENKETVNEPVVGKITNWIELLCRRSDKGRSRC